MEQKEIQFLVIILSISFLTLMVFLLMIFFTFHKKKTTFLLEKMESDLRFQSELVKTQIEIKDQTLSEISKELHDNIGQILSVAIMQVNRFSLDENKKISKAELLDLKEILAKSLDEIRVLSKIINRENYVKLDFVTSIQQDLERIRKLKKIDCNCDVVGEVQPINSEHELIIYRIFQEAIHNVLRHSHSESIDIKIVFTPKHFKVDLTDKGVGFDMNEKSSGMGLHNMMLRSKLIGASLTIDSDANGTVLSLDYPLQTEDE